MSPILLLNPRKKSRRRMPSGLRKYWASRRRASNPRRRRHARSRVRASNPRRRRARARTVVYANPRRRRRRSHARRYSNPRRRQRGFASTPGRGSIIGNYVLPAAVGAVGAIGFDIAWGYAQPYLPSALQSGWVGTVVELAGIWAVLFGIKRYAPRSYRVASAAATGAATIVAYNALKGVAQQVLPSSTPGLSGYMPAARYPLGGLRGLGAYQRNSLRGLGDLYSPAAIVQSPVPQQFGGYQPHSGGGGGTITPDYLNDGM
jgi:hypothetical protein